MAELFPAKGSLEPCCSIACRIAGRTRACFEARLTTVVSTNSALSQTPGMESRFRSNLALR